MTALIVEAAELAEIFQWMTPEQSASAHTDAVVREQISDEVADVLLYLIQIADHSQVDLKRTIGRKLVKNAKKHTPLRTGLPAGTAAMSTVETHVLVDWENVQPKESDLRALVPDITDVWIFYGPNQKVDLESYESFGSRATAVKIARLGKNALDFQPLRRGSAGAPVLRAAGRRLLPEVPENLLDHRSLEVRRHELQLARKPPATTGSSWPGDEFVPAPDSCRSSSFAPAR